MEANINKEHLEASGFDLDYDEIIIIQLDLIEQIVINTKDKQILVLLDLPIITDKLIETIDRIHDCYILVFADNFEKQCNIESNHICYINNKFNDLYSDELLYNNIIMELPFNMTLNQLKEEIIKIINHDITDKNCIISKLL